MGNNGNSELIYSISERLGRAKKAPQGKANPDRWKTIERFLDSCQTEGLSKARCLRYVYDLAIISRLLETGFESATKDDIKKLVARIEDSGYAENTKYGMRVCIKKFYKWLKGNGEFFPEEVRWIKNNHKNGRIKTPEDMLTEKEILSVIRVASNPRDKAFVSVLAETGCRIGELLTCRIQHYKKSIDQRTAHILLNGKTGFRNVMIVASVPYVDDWINMHPFNGEPECFIFTSDKGKLVTNSRTLTILREIAKRAGIKKAVNPHNFRHTMATYLATRFTESQLKQYLGWTQASEMAAVYVHLSGRDVDKTVMKLNGIEVKEEQHEESVMKLKECFRCAKTNEHSAKFCSGCGSIMDKEEMDRLIQDDLERKKTTNT